MERRPYGFQRPRFGGQKTGSPFQAGSYGYQSGQQVPSCREGIPPETQHGPPQFSFPAPGCYRAAVPPQNEASPAFTPPDGGPEFSLSPQAHRGPQNAGFDVGMLQQRGPPSSMPQHGGPPAAVQQSSGPWFDRPPGDLPQQGMIPERTPPGAMPHHAGQLRGPQVSIPPHRQAPGYMPQYGGPQGSVPRWGGAHTGMHHQGGPLVTSPQHIPLMADMSQGEGFQAGNSEQGKPHTSMPLYEDNRPGAVLHGSRPGFFDSSALPFMSDTGSVNDSHVQHPLPRNVLKQSSVSNKNLEGVKQNISELNRGYRHMQQTMNYAPQVELISSENLKEQLPQHDLFGVQRDEFVQDCSSIPKRDTYLHKPLPNAPHDGRIVVQGRSTVHGEGPARFQERHGDNVFLFGDNGPSDKEIYQQWLSSFLSHRRRKPQKNEPVRHPSVTDARGLVYSALHLVTQLSALCKTLENCDESADSWNEHYSKAVEIRMQLEKKMKTIEEPNFIEDIKRKILRIRKKRLRRKRAKEDTEEGKAEAEHLAEKEARIDRWRMQCVQEVEEKKRERELKAAADSVLSEVRKKQSDTKKMLEVLRSLEKLRKLRKEAAARKGVFPPTSADETFEKHIQRLRELVHTRTTLYDAEERALKVIVDCEQAEERKRDKENRQKKEREKFFQKQREADAMLFGDEELLPPLHPLQPFRQYYLQAEQSVVSLVQIRHEWDQFLVQADHPDASSIPRGWVLPEPPASDTWATAVQQIE
eukprot:XP_002938405.2 PREDICTED: programmed cell death protein 7 [Xenopus tropicalis]